MGRHQLNRRELLASLSLTTIMMRAPTSARLTILTTPAFEPPTPLAQLGFVSRLYRHARIRAIANLHAAGQQPAQIAAELDQLGLLTMNREPGTTNRPDALTIDNLRR